VDEAAVEALLDAGFPVNFRAKHTNRYTNVTYYTTPIYWAAMKAKSRIVQLLLKRGTRPLGSTVNLRTRGKA
jgi:ankyrin repeat protein